jgi:dihydroxyacetone kinase-like protein
MGRVTPVDTTVTVPDLLAWVEAFQRHVHDERDHLTALDSAIGDADHGINLDRGMTAVVGKVAGAAPDTVDALCRSVGMTLVSTVGGASGPLYGTFFLRFGTASGALERLDAAGLAAALRAGLDGVVARGRAEPGDKTMVDALGPAVAAFEDAAASGVLRAAAAARDAAEQGRDATIPLVARKGRASYLGERSAGHIDPGAASSALLVRALAEALGALPAEPPTDAQTEPSTVEPSTVGPSTVETRRAGTPGGPARPPATGG